MTDRGPSPWVVTFYGETTFPGPRGCETVFWPVPFHRWYTSGGGRRVLDEALVEDDLRGLAAVCADRAGRQLHHADWVITADVTQIREIGAPAGCDQGWPGLPSILPWLSRHPGREVAAGVLHWLAELPGYVPLGGSVHKHLAAGPGWVQHEHATGSVAHDHDPDTGFQVPPGGGLWPHEQPGG